jgi:hypothetical protein
VTPEPVDPLPERRLLLSRRQVIAESLVVAGLSLGESAVYAVVRLIDMLSRAPLAEQEAKLNSSASERPWFDLVYQLLGNGFALVPVALVLVLLGRDRLLLRGLRAAPSASPLPEPPGAGAQMQLPGAQCAEPEPGPELGPEPEPEPGRGAEAAEAHSPPGVLARLGVTRAPGRDLGRGVLLFVLMGAGTLGVYAAGRALGMTAQIQTDNLGAHWWTVPVLLFAAVKNSLLEEVLLMGYFRIRLHMLGLSPWTVIVVLAVFRGSYHLYQGVGPFVGNVAMGLVFGWCALRWERRRGDTIMPFVWAHLLLDAVGFLAPGVLHMVDAG